jgi:hypothetical protein
MPTPGPQNSLAAVAAVLPLELCKIQEAIPTTTPASYAHHE